jgi:hypothetical protein
MDWLRVQEGRRQKWGKGKWERDDNLTFTLYPKTQEVLQLNGIGTTFIIRSLVMKNHSLKANLCPNFS